MRAGGAWWVWPMTSSTTWNVWSPLVFSWGRVIHDRSQLQSAPWIGAGTLTRPGARSVRSSPVLDAFGRSQRSGAGSMGVLYPQDVAVPSDGSGVGQRSTGTT